MSKFTIISPIHIGSGETYENFLIYNGYRYDFYDFLTTVFHQKQQQLLSREFLFNLKKLSFKNSGDAKNQIKRVILPTNEEIKKIDPLYPIELALNPRQLNEKSISSFMKSMNKPFIPGSSIKGYLLNVIYYDILSHEPKIKKHIQEFLIKAVQQTENQRKPDIEKTFAYKDLRKLELSVLTEASQYLICRDVIVEKPVSIYYVSRQTKNGQIPQVAEFVDKDFEVNEDVILVNQLKKDQDYDQTIQGEMTKAFVDRIKNIKIMLKPMNDTFIKNTMLYQRKYITSNQNNKKINQFQVLDQLDYTEEKIKEGHIVFQLGKFTNYISKSMGMAFGLDFYQQLFKDVFRPHWKTKLFEIGSMNLLAYPEDDQDFDQIPGYVIFEW